MKFKLIAILLFAFLTTKSFAQLNESEINSGIDSVLSDYFFKSTLMGIKVYDLSQNKVLFEKNDKLLMKPASNMKILTTAAGLVFLGPDYNFTTSIKYSGKIINGILYGDLFAVGGCDPDFTTKDIDSLVNVIKKSGIKEITGHLYGDVSMMDSLFWGNGWMWDDDPSTDAPYLTPLCVNTNSVGVIVKPGKPGDKAELTMVPQTNYFNIINNTLTVIPDSSNTYSLNRDWMHRKNTLIVEGNINTKAVPDSLTDTLRVNAYRPDLYFLTLMKEHLGGSGIEVKGDIDTSTAPASAVDLFDFKRSFKNVIVNLNKVSYNLGAEMTMYAMAAKFFGEPATAKHGVMMTDSLLSLSGMNPSDYRLVDGSGVSHYNLISAELIVAVLKYMYENNVDLFNILRNSFPVAGVDGTLKNRMIDTPAQGIVHAKTGTLSGVASLSGYLTSKNGHLLAFSMLVQNFVGSSKPARDFQDRICNILVNY